jgi:hypothetical protein
MTDNYLPAAGPPHRGEILPPESADVPGTADVVRNQASDVSRSDVEAGKHVADVARSRLRLRRLRPGGRAKTFSGRLRTRWGSKRRGGSSSWRIGSFRSAMSSARWLASPARAARSTPRMLQSARQPARVAAGLIAIWAGWLVGSLLPASSAGERAAPKVKDAAVPAVSGAAKDAAAGLQPSAKHAAESVKATAAAATVTDETASSVTTSRIRHRQPTTL